MKLCILIAFLLCIVSTGVGQENPWPMPAGADYPKIPLRGKRISDFVPRGYKIVSKIYGDLNGDKLPDVALHIRGTFGRFITKLDFQEYDSNPRILVILFRENGVGYRLAERSNKFITTPDSPAMSEPFQRMSIVNRVLKLDFELWLSAGGWGATNGSYRFRYQKGQFFLIGADREDYMRNSIEIYMESYNFLTRKIKSTEGIRKDIENAQASYRRPKIKWRTLHHIKLRTLKDLGPAFSWEIEHGTFL